MSRLIVIPARLQSSRLPGKVLLPLLGRPMLWHVWQRALCSEAEVLIAAADEQIADVAHHFGAQVVLTDPDLPSGTDRVAAALWERDGDHVINLQADEPLVEVSTLLRLFEALEDPSVAVCTPAAPMSEDPGPSVVKVVVDAMGDALYFSRAAIPHGGPYLRHVGLYGYQREALLDFVGRSVGALERTESLEQLRLLEQGCRIRVCQVSSAPPSVDTAEDLALVRELLEAQ